MGSYGEELWIFRKTLGHWEVVLKGVGDLRPLLLSPFASWLRRQTILLHYVPPPRCVVLPWSHWGQSTVGWQLLNCETQYIFSPLSETGLTLLPRLVSNS